MTIKDVSEKTGFSTYTLRYYEKEGVLQGVKRDDSGHRAYSQNDIDVLHFLNCLKMTDMSVKDIKKFTTLLYEGDETIPERLELLKKQKREVIKKLERTKESLEHIDWKIQYYTQTLDKNKY